MTRLLLLSFVATISSLWTLTAVAEPSAESQPDLDVVFPVYFSSPEEWRGMQSIQADGKGRVYLLRTETMEEYAINREGELEDPKQMQILGLEPPRDIRIAVLGDERGEWFLFGQYAFLFSDHRELSVEATPGMPFQAAMVEGEPYVLLAPGRPGRDDESALLARWTGVDWDVVATKRADKSWSPVQSWNLWAAILLPGSSNDLWLVYINLPKIERYHARTGKVEVEILLDPEADFSRGDNEVARDRAKLEDKQIATDPSRRIVKRQVDAATKRTVHHAAALSPDGAVYLLAASEDDPERRLLRRWSPMNQSLEEVAVAYDVAGLATMVFGEDGLHIAQFDVVRGRAFIDLETLETAAWRPVHGVVVDGVPLDPPGEAAQTKREP